MIELLIHKKDGSVLFKEQKTVFGAKLVAKTYLSDNQQKIYWICVLNYGEIEFEYIDPSYCKVLETLYYGSEKNSLTKDQKDALTRLSIENPVLFDKYLDFLRDNSKFRVEIE